MTYEEIKAKLTKCEVKLQQIKTLGEKTPQSSNIKTAVQKLTLLKESLEKQLKEADKGVIYTDDERKAKELSDKGSNVKLTKEQEGIAFSVDETKAIAKKVGKAVAMSLNQVGDEVAHMKARDIEENSFEIYVQYKNGADDQFSFYISDDTLHLTDFSFDKELVDVGVKPSGEAIVHVDVLANELAKHFKSMQEGMSDQEFADAQEKDRLDKHPEKDTIMKIKALIAKEKEAKLKEAPEGMYYIKIPRDKASQNKAQVILNDLYGIDYEISDNKDGIVLYFDKNKFDAGILDDLAGDEVQIIDTNIPMDEKVSEADVDAQVDGGDLDVGHQDDEPDMLMKDIYDIATYAAKLHKMLNKYNQFDGEVDFPHWWQKKVTLARDYISAAQHYLEAEEKQPALDQLALENKGASKGEEEKFHKDLDTLVHKTFGKRKEELKEDWGGSDQAAMNQQIHKALGSPKKMPSPFDDKLEYAVQDAVDFHWDDWPEYQQDREGLYTQAKRAYLRAMFRDTFDKMVRMFEPADEATINENTDAVRELHSILDQLYELSEEAKSIMKGNFPEAFRRGDAYGAFDFGTSANSYDTTFEKILDSLGEEDDLDEGIGKTKKAYDLVITKMKELAKVYKAGDTSVIGQLKDLTAKKKQLEKMLHQDVANKDRNLEISEEYSVFKNYDDIIGGIITRFGALQKYVKAKEPDALTDLQKVLRAFEIFDEKMAYGAHEELEEVNEDHTDNPKDKYVVRPCKNKKEPWAVWEGEKRVKGFAEKKDAQAFADKKNKEQGLNEDKATCCGKCGRVHVKGTKCKTPFLKGKDHCKYN